MKIYKITEASEYLGVSINTLKMLVRTASGTDVIRITGTHWRELPAPPQEAADANN
jgi:hypothetical protein